MGAVIKAKQWAATVAASTHSDRILMTVSVLPHTVSKVGERDAGIDGLRALAMSMVIAQHCGLLPFGWTGVWLFYVISGYVIARGFEQASTTQMSAPAWTQLLSFWRRRVARLLPAYVVYLALNVLVLTVLDRPEPMDDLPWLLSFTFNWHMIFGERLTWPPFGHLWTLSVEQQFYVAFPLLMLLLGDRSRTVLTVALVMAGPALRWMWSQSLTAQGMPNGQVAFGVYAASHVQLDAFLMGSLLARAQHTGHLAGPAGLRWSRRLWWAALACASVYAGAYVWLNHSQGKLHGMNALRDVFSGVLNGQGRQAWVYTVVALVSSALLTHVLMGRRFSATLANGMWARIGRASYSGYLFHLLLLWTLGELLGSRVRDLAVAQRLLGFVGVWLMTVMVSLVSLKWVEEPLTQWHHRLVRRTA